MELELIGGYMRNGVKHHTELSIPVSLLAVGSSAGLAEQIKDFLESECNIAAIQGPRMVPSYHEEAGGEDVASDGGDMGGDEGGFDFGLGDFFGGDDEF